MSDNDSSDDQKEGEEEYKYEEARLDCSGTNVYFAKAGKGPTNILFLHDMISSYSIDFKRHLEKFDHEKYTMVAWDAPGSGRSIPPEKDHSPEGHVKEAKQAFELMEKLGLVPFSICAYGTGGPTALHMAYNNRNTDKIQKLILWGTSAYVSPRQKYAYSSPVRDPTLWADTKKRPLLDVYSEEVFQKLWTEHCAAKLAHYEDKKSKGNICGEILGEINQPVLILYPEFDFYYSEDEMDDLEEMLPNSGLIFCEEMYHTLHLQSFDWFKDTVDRFIQADEDSQFDIVDEERTALEEKYYKGASDVEDEGK